LHSNSTLVTLYLLDDFVQKSKHVAKQDEYINLLKTRRVSFI